MKAFLQQAGQHTTINTICLNIANEVATANLTADVLPVLELTACSNASQAALWAAVMAASLRRQHLQALVLPLLRMRMNMQDASGR